MISSLRPGASQIYKEKVSGSTRHRPQLEEVLRYLRKGDQLIVKSMDRLARSLVDLHTIVESLDSSEEFHGAGHIKKLDVGEEDNGDAAEAHGLHATQRSGVRHVRLPAC